MSRTTKCEIYVGDCLETLKIMADQSVNCCVTSPPYFGLRDYGVDGQLGREPSPDEFVRALVNVFREVRRVLRDDGTLWLNLGDSYARNPAKGQHKPGQSGGKNARVYDSGNGRASATFLGECLKEKDLIGVPWRVAFALQADGWYLRQDIIWHKPNPIPESVKDRCTKAHEYIFLLSKSPRYYFDHQAMQEPTVYPPGTREDAKKGSFKSKGANDAARVGDESFRAIRETRNKRSVWSVSTKPFKGAHFAAFPPALIEPCILAGCPEGGTVLDPFGGSGTTAGVSVKNARNAILCELNGGYANLVPNRVASIAPGVTVDVTYRECGVDELI